MSLNSGKRIRVVYQKSPSPAGFWVSVFEKKLSLEESFLSRIDLSPNVWLHCSVDSSSHRYCGNHGLESRCRPIFSGFFFQIA